MKNYHNITLLILLFTIHQSFAQKIEVIDYGLAYKDVREMTYYDFKDNSNGYIGNVKLTYLLEGYGLYNYPSSFVLCSFPENLKSKNYKLGNQYLNELETITKEFEYYSSRVLFDSFRKGGKEAYDYMQFYLEKFEIISEYYKELYNYSLDKQEEKNIIANKNQVLEKSIASDKNVVKGKIENDSALKKLIANKKKSINDISTKYDNKIQQIELQKKNEIKGLQISNYAQNKRKIIAKYEPKISNLNTQKNEEIQSAKLYWDDKITTRKKEIEKIVANEMTELEKTKVQLQSSQRQEIKSQNNLTQRREDIETSYQKAISEINEKIKNLLK